MSFVVSSCNCCWLRNIKTVGIGGTGGAISLPNFGRSVNPSLIRLCPLHYHPGFQTFLRFCTYRHKRKGTLQESKCLCLALQWGNWIRTSCSLVRTKQEFLCHPEVVAWELRMFGIPFGNTSTTIVQLVAIAFLAFVLVYNIGVFGDGDRRRRQQEVRSKDDSTGPTEISGQDGQLPFPSIFWPN